MQATLKVMNDADPSLEKLQQRVGWLRRDPGNATLYRQCADAAMALRRYDLLLEIADLALQSHPLEPALRFDRANAQIGLHDYRAALTTLGELQSPSLEEQNAIRANLALCHYCLGEYAEALPHLQHQYQLGQRTPRLLFMLVRSRHYLGELDEAAAIANDNVEAANADAALAGAYALLYLDVENTGAAARWAATALRLDPHSIDGNVTEGMLAIMRMQTARAQQLFKVALDGAPGTARAWFGLGSIALLQQDPQSSESHFKRGLEFMPEFIGAWHMLAWTQLMQRDLTGAEASLNHALALDRNFGETHGALAMLDAMKGATDSARHRLIIARRLDRDCLSAQFAAALLEDPSLQGVRSQEILNKLLLGIAGQNQSALNRVLLQRTRR